MSTAEPIETAPVVTVSHCCTVEPVSSMSVTLLGELFFLFLFLAGFTETLL